MKTIIAEKEKNRSVISKDFFVNALQQYSFLILLVLLCILLSIFSPHFLTVDNFTNILRQISVNFILATGMTFVIITAGIDLSVGSILAFSGVISATYLSHDGNIFMALIIGLVVGLFCGILNGFFIAKAKLNPFIVTLGMMSIARGLALVVTDGNSVTINNSSYVAIGSGNLFGIPMPVIIAIFIFIFAYILLNKTRVGRYMYAIGGSKETSRLSGIKVDKILLFVYGMSGMLAGLAAIVLTSRLWAAPPIAGEGYELQAIAAAVIGGASLMGGKGGIGGTLYGALLIGIISNGLNLLGVSSFYQQVVIGSIIIIAVLFDRFRNQ